MNNAIKSEFSYPAQIRCGAAFSKEEAEALGRFVHDLRTRAGDLAALMHRREYAYLAVLAGSIRENLQTLETELLHEAQREDRAPRPRRMAATAGSALGG